MKYPEEGTIKREKIDQWLPRARGEGVWEVIAKYYRAKCIESLECTMFILYLHI